MLTGNSSDTPKVRWFQGNTIKTGCWFFLLCRNFGENLTVEDDTSLQLLEMERIRIRNGSLEMLLLSNSLLLGLRGKETECGKRRSINKF